MRIFAVCLVLALCSACGGRELGWLVPRASIGVVLRATESGVATDGYVSFGAPLTGPDPRPLEEADRSARQLHLLGRGPRCRVAPLCRWEAASSARVFTELAEEESP